MKRWLKKWIIETKIWYYRWRYKWLFECFDSIDKYYDHTNLRLAAEHIKQWGELRRKEGVLAEKYRQENCGLKVLLLSNGIDEETINASDWINNCFGLDSISDLIPQDLGRDIIDFIIKSNLVRADQKGLCVWSINAPNQIRMAIMDLLFYKKV